MKDSILRRTFGQLLGGAAIGSVIPGRAGAGAPEPPTTAGGAGSDDPCALTAVELATRIRSRELSAREVMAAHLARIERVNPKVNAIVTLVAERAMADAGKADESAGPRRHAGAAARAAGRAQGPRQHRGDPDDVRLALLPRLRARQGRDHRHPHPSRGCDHARQDEHAGVRRRVSDVQRGVRCHAQPLRPREDGGRQQRRRGLRAHDGHGADRRRQRHRGLAAQPRGVLQRRRLPPVARPRGARRRLVVAAVRLRADGPHGRRRRALPQRDRRPVRR